jgi:hypothetical protein
MRTNSNNTRFLKFDTGNLSTIAKVEMLIKKTNFFIISFLLFLYLPGKVVHAQQLKGAEKYDTTLAFQHSPKKASFYSAVVPGMGQIYNGKWYKVPFIYAGAGTIGYFIYFNNKEYVRFKTAYLKKVSNDPNDKVEASLAHLDQGRLKYVMDYWRRNRDLLVLGMAALYLANILDATVDAYLFDYDVSQDLSLQLKPSVFESTNTINFGLTCSLRF